MRVKEGEKEKAILDAAVKVFAQHGYHQAKISAIAEKAKVATGSVYLYFRNKEEILVTLFEQLWKSVLARASEEVSHEGHSPEENLMCLIDLAFEAFQRNPGLATVFINEQHSLLAQRRGRTIRPYDDFLDLAMRIIREGVRSKSFRKDTDLNFLRHFFLGGFRSMLQLWTQQPDTYRLQDIRTNVKQLIMHGLAGQ